MKKSLSTLTKAQYTKAKLEWKQLKSPFSMYNINRCATLAKKIILYEEECDLKQGVKTKRTRRLSKYDAQHHIRLIFSKSGNVIYYSNFPKTSDIANTKLGETPELTITKACKLTSQMQEGVLNNHTVKTVFNFYEKSLIERHNTAPTKFAASSLKTYQCMLKKLRQHFPLNQSFKSLTAGELEKIIDRIIVAESNTQAIVLFAQIRRVWKFAKNKFNSGKNPATDIDDFYVSDRVESPRPCQAYTDLDSIAELWINLASAPNIHQKNAARFMILTGIRPINIPQMKWEWLNSIDFPTLITFPASVVGVRGEMKNQKEYKLPLTKAMRAIILEQRAWMENALPNCNPTHIFLQPRDVRKPFAKRSLDKVIKDYSPVDAVKGDQRNIVMKGSAGAFCTMCRSFFKSNTKAIMVDNGYHFRHAEELTRLALHHLRKNDDPNGLNYDRSEELFGTSTKLKFNVFKIHEVSILKRAKELESQKMRLTGMQSNQAKNLKENNVKKALRDRIKAYLVYKGSYVNFINQPLGDTGRTTKDLILTAEGRAVVERYLNAQEAKAKNN
ncbi:hypothetical protein OIZ54_15795 [Pseudoalteromonas sp. A3]|uniref:hypothetical protein n=1 Tax=unclassified Pseudoalteromonas TaxID=194690 RepID=UPI0020BFCB81|nr:MULTISPECIES: hypothetical protein [unclassified Pseudoalteromonas]MCK8095955.1 hypothetical protein [Pseudoalteromonas sp. 1CM17D]MCW1720202.1 hypothetical protein [Pseudoalteromonas sp. A3]